MNHDSHDETFHFSCDLQAPRSARRLVARVLRARGWHDRDVERAQLAASELVTNAVVNAQTAATMRVRVGGPDVRLDVSDEAPNRVPVLREVDPQQVGGLGLRLVAALSRAWGVDRRPSAKAVWCELVAAFPFRPVPGRGGRSLGAPAPGPRYA